MKSLLCVKSIMTICLTVVLCALCFLYPDEYSETMKSCVTMVVTFYFAHQSDKHQNEVNGNAKRD